jgi:cysteine synthase B
MSVLSAIGNTPLVELARVNPKHPRVRVLGKLEGNNPGGSVKDRPAWRMVRAAEAAGELRPGRTIIEPTSGNTGIALAMIGAARGYRVVLCMPECVSVERRHILQAFGAETILTPAAEGTDGAIRRAHAMLAEDPDKYYMPNQFENCHNIMAHYETTGPEIYDQTDGAVDVFVAGMGTTGTLMGMARYLKEKKPAARVIGMEPVVGHTVQGLKNMEESIVPGIFQPEVLDERWTVQDDEAFTMMRRLVREEGLFLGASSGASVAGAVRAAQDMDEGTVVALLPDRGDRYLSTSFFKSFCARCPP